MASLLFGSSLWVGCTLSFETPTDARVRDAARADGPSAMNDASSTLDGSTLDGETTLDAATFDATILDDARPDDAARDDARDTSAPPPSDAARDGDAAGCDPARCPADPCQRAVCAADGRCAQVPLAVGTGCDDGDPCTTADSCDSVGDCRGAPCADDANPCTAVECRPDGCVTTNVEDMTTCSGPSPLGAGRCCSGACVSLATSPMHCGACSTMCVAPGGGTAMCADGRCVACEVDSDCLPPGGLPECLRRIDCAGESCRPEINGPSCYIDGVCWRSGQRNPANPCQVCSGRSTTWSSASTCDDGVFCTSPDSCVAGTCRAGPPRDCDDGNACTDDSCNEAADRCDHVPNGAVTCDDGNACTTSDRCAADGSCSGSSVSCPDPGVACQYATCDPSSGCGVGIEPDGASCAVPGCPVTSTCFGGMCFCD